MLPDQQDQRDRQLEVLRRYVAELSTTPRRRDDEPPRPPEPAEEWQLPGGLVLLAVLVLVSAALIGGFLIGRGSVPRSTASAAATVGAPAPGGAAGEPAESGAAAAAGSSDAAPAAPAATAECKTAVDRANRSLAHAVKVEKNLAEHTRIMNDLMNGRIDGDTALRTGMPSLVQGAAESSRFDVALAAYQQVVDQCRLQTP
jgi:hypothetical protein